MKSYIAAVILLVAGAFVSCNNSGESTQITDSTNIQSAPDKTINADTAKIKDTSSYGRMPQKMNDSPRVH